MSNKQQTRDVDMRVIMMECSFYDLGSFCNGITLTPSVNWIQNEPTVSPHSTGTTNDYDYSAVSADGLYELKFELTSNRTRMYTLTSKTFDKLTKISFDNIAYSITKVYSFNPIFLETIDNLFYDCRGLTYVNATDWDLSHIKTMYRTFRDCEELKTIEGIETWNVSNIESMEETFLGCKLLESLDLSNWRLNNLITMSETFSGCSSLKSLGEIGNWDFNNLETIQSPFAGTAIAEMDVSSWNIRTVKKLEVFKSMKSLTSVGDISKWDTSNVEDLYGFMLGCESIEEIDLTGWDVRKVKDFGCAFYECFNLKEIKGIENWNLESAENISACFSYNYVLETLDLSNWGKTASNLNDVTYLFEYCINLKTINVNNLVKNTIDNLEGMFLNCYSLEYINGLDTWDVSNVTSMECLFCNCINLKNLDGITFWNTPSLEMIYDTFVNCFSVGSIDLSNWTTDNTVDVCSCFDMYDPGDDYAYERMPNLEDIKPITIDLTGLTFNFEHYARWPMFETEPGYEFIKNIILRDTTYTTVNNIIGELYDRTGVEPGAIYIDGVSNQELIDYVPVVNKNWKFYAKVNGIDSELFIEKEDSTFIIMHNNKQAPLYFKDKKLI
jgi:surface protein